MFTVNANVFLIFQMKQLYFLLCVLVNLHSETVLTSG